VPDPAESRRKGGRKGRRDAIVNAPIIHRPELRRNIPIYDVINTEGVELIHDFAMRLVEQVGVS
jgi:trimethylamine:corrinoid methyltransferase-like protein